MFSLLFSNSSFLNRFVFEQENPFRYGICLILSPSQRREAPFQA